MERKIRILDAARNSTPIILRTCSVHLSYLLLKLMVPALRIVLNGSSEKVKTTVLISHHVTNIQANLASRWYSILMPVLSAIPFLLGLCTNFQQRNMGNRISQRNLRTDGERTSEVAVWKSGTTTSLIRFGLKPFNKIKLISQLYLHMLICT